MEEEENNNEEDEDSEEYKDEETELERYLRDVNGKRAKTAPIRPIKYVE